MDSIGSFSYFPSMFNFEATRLSMSESLQRLSTGERINSGKDDPAGMIISQNLRATLAALEAESRALERNDHVAAVADGALGEISSMLVDAEALAVANANTAGMSDEEIAANQMEIDSILSTVSRLVSNTNFNGQSIFDGTMTLTAGDQSFQISALSLDSLGSVDIDGETYTLAEVASGGALDSSLGEGDAGRARQVIRQALSDISTLRGQIGAFQSNSIGAQLGMVETQIENVAAADATVADTEYAVEISKLNRDRTLSLTSLAGLKQTSELSKLVLQLLQ